MQLAAQTWTRVSSVQEGKTTGMAPEGHKYVEHALYVQPFAINPERAAETGVTDQDCELFVRLAPHVFDGLTSRALPVVVLSVVCGAGALVLLLRDAARGARVLAVVAPLKGQRQGLNEQVRRLGQLCFEVANAVLGAIERVDIEKFEPGEFISKNVRAACHFLESFRDVVLRQLVMTLRFGVVGRRLEQQSDQLGRSDLAELHVHDMERGSRPIDGKQFVDGPVHVLGTFADTSHPPIVYPIALTMAAPHAEPAERLLQHLRSPEVRARFDAAGYK